MARDSHNVRYKVTNLTNKVTYEIENVRDKVRLQDLLHSDFNKY